MKKILFLLAFVMLFTTNVDAQHRSHSSRRSSTTKTTTPKTNNVATSNQQVEIEVDLPSIFGYAAKWKDKAEAGKKASQAAQDSILVMIKKCKTSEEMIQTIEEVASVMLKEGKTEEEVSQIIGEVLKNLNGDAGDAEAHFDGDAEAQFELAWCYYWGIGVKGDNAKAMEWAKKSSAQGYPLATELIGEMYYHGIGVDKNQEMAWEWFGLACRQASDGIDSYLQSNKHTILSRPFSYRTFCLEESDLPRGFDLFMNDKSLSTRYLSYGYTLGRIYFYRYGYCDTGVTKTFGYNMIMKMAEAGYARAQYDLGYAYDRDNNDYFHNISKDYAEAVKWYRKAAEQGHPFAMYNLGICYDNGEGVAQDHVEANKWFRKAAELGHAGAMYNLGCNYDNGEGVAQNHVEANKWYRKAAELGHAGAMYNLGISYEEGEGIAKNHQLAKEWITKAANLGYSDAKDWLRPATSSSSSYNPFKNIAGVWKSSDTDLQLKFDSNGHGWARLGNRGQWEVIGVKHLGGSDFRLYGEGWTKVCYVIGNSMMFGNSSDYYYNFYKY